MGIRRIVVLFSLLFVLLISCKDGVSKTTQKEESTIIFDQGDSVTKQLGSGTFTNSVAGVGDGALTYTCSDTVVSVDSTSGEVTLLGGGIAFVYVEKAATPTHGSASESYIIYISKIDSSLIFADGTISYESSDEGVATVDSSTGEVSLLAGGETTITAEKAGTNTHNTVIATYSLVVNKPSTPVAFTRLSVNGSVGTDSTTALTLTFDKDPETLKESLIALSGATMDSFSGTGTTRTISISKITVADGQDITVTLADPTGYAFTPFSLSTAIHVAPALGVKYQGGIIVYFLKQSDPGYESGVLHGLIGSEEHSYGEFWIKGGSTDETLIGGTS